MGESNKPKFNPKAAEFNPSFLPSTVNVQPAAEEEELVETFNEQLTIDDFPQSFPRPSVEQQQLLDPYIYETGPILPLQYHLYAPPEIPSHQLPSNQRTVHSFFISEDIRRELLRKQECFSKRSDLETEQKLPQCVNTYHSLYPLGEKNKSHLYRATSSSDGFPLLNSDSINRLEPWTQLKHANLISLKEAFTTKAFHDVSVIFVYDYHPTAVSLHEKYFNNKGRGHNSSNKRFQKSQSLGLEETVIWSFLCQIASILKLIHNRGLAYSNLNLQKVLVTGEKRVRLSCGGVSDLIMFNPSITILQRQQEDLIAFGQLLISLACANTRTTDINASLTLIAQSYSPGLYQVIMFLLSNHVPGKSIDELTGIIAPRILQQLDLVQQSHDHLEAELSKELENSRLVRLLIKLGFINERPEFGMDPQWSETGDRYLLKLFRDYVFHQVDAEGKPVLDLAHVLSSLNMFDAASPERIQLTSRDERSCLIVSFQDLKRCAESAYGELSKNSSTS